MDFASVLIRTIDNKKDGLILINGLWGSGKTYYLNNVFKELYSDRPVYYISLLGIKNTTDFKNKIIKVAYLDSPQGLESLMELTRSSLNTIQGELGDTFLKGVEVFTGAIQERVLNSLNGVFILDDIERIEEDIQYEILTYCYQNQQSKNIDKMSEVTYIFVGNFSSETDLNIRHKEKLISDELPFPGINTLDFIEKKEMEQKVDIRVIALVIDSLELKNLRIIEKITDKINEVVANMSHSGTPDPGSFVYFVKNISTCILLKEKYNFRRDTFDDYENGRLLRLMPGSKDTNKSPEQKTKEQLFDKIDGVKYQTQLLDYIFNMESAKDLADIFLPITSKTNKDDYAYLSTPHLLDINESEYTESLKKAILRLNESSLKKWLIAVRNYTNNIKDKYINEIDGLSVNSINNVKESFSDNEILEYVESQFQNVTYVEAIHFSENMDEFGQFFRDKYFKIRLNREKEEIIRKITTDGWISVGNEIMREPFRSKLLESIGVENIILGFENSWTTRDILDFSNHIKNIYTPGHAIHNPDEINYLEFLNEKTTKLLDSLTPSFKYGAINQLKNCIDNILYINSTQALS
ncbi:hypothetical protein HZI30_18755 [Serratia fonticola]|uniref:P-loop NTPase fold protein n=1 Tax=Serratia fonticola TaxID=47917 RepID=UPI0015C5E11D|nr:P-loop NTPase fold protein [Serratia fonticola]NXZ88979.1 hypothetical protein [Serratia fonticola]